MNQKYRFLGVLVASCVLLIGTHAAALRQAGAQIAHNPASLLFLGSVGQPENTPQVLQITNTGEGSLNWSASCYPSWLTCRPESGSTPAELTVTVNTASMLEGTYDGTIELTSPEATNSPQQVEVILIMEGEPNTGGCVCTTQPSAASTLILTLLLMLFIAIRPRTS